MEPVNRKSPIKAALLSGLVFPGLGYLYLRQFKIGLFVMLLTGGIVILMIRHALTIANLILEQLQGDLSISDTNALFELVHQTMEQNSASIYDVFSYLLPILWIGSTIHCYLLAAKQKQETIDLREQ